MSNEDMKELLNQLVAGKRDQDERLLHLLNAFNKKANMEEQGNSIHDTIKKPPMSNKVQEQGNSIQDTIKKPPMSNQELLNLIKKLPPEIAGMKISLNNEVKSSTIECNKINVISSTTFSRSNNLQTD